MPATDSHDSFESTENSHSGLEVAPANKNIGGGVVNKTLIRATRAELLAERQAMILAIMAELLGPADLERAADAFVGALHQRLGASRVSLALFDAHETLQLNAISQQARVDLASNEVRLLLSVMEEGLEQESLVRFPASEKRFVTLPAHQELASRGEQTSIVTVPLHSDKQAIGAILLERYNAEPFVAGTIQLLKHIALRSGPTLALRRDAERTTIQRACLSANQLLEQCFGSQGVGRRILLASTIAVVALGMLMPMQNRVSAHAELVPSERRLITAPFDGYIESVSVGPGEQVSAGQLVATLETRELELEGSRRDGEIGSVEAEFRAAMASQDRQATAVARARLERERALRALIDQRLDRIELRAPIAGHIINGDPSDLISTPITRGETIFEVAQADAYDVHIMVHERDIHKVSEGQSGSLYLRARPDEELKLQVHAIQPVAQSSGGASRFRVRTRLTVPTGIVPRPGESGIARINVGNTNLIEIIGRPIVGYFSKLWWRLSG